MLGAPGLCGGVSVVGDAAVWVEGDGVGGSDLNHGSTAGGR